jgi:DNA helicase II / ATP-dependent DNA helicase PcrA
MKARIFLRVAERLGAGVVDRLGPMYIGTIHASCFRLLQEHVPQYANFDVLDDHRHAALLSREFMRLKLNEIGDQHWRPIGDFMCNADVIENELIDGARLGKTAFGRCYRDYCAMLRRYRFLTYGRLITSAVEALETPRIFERVHGPLRHLIVDEYQDINPAQERLIELLAKTTCAALCCRG